MKNTLTTLTTGEALDQTTTCDGSYCPNQTASMGETEGVAAIKETYERCKVVSGCILQNVSTTFRTEIN